LSNDIKITRLPKQQKDLENMETLLSNCNSVIKGTMPFGPAKSPKQQLYFAKMEYRAKAP